MSPPKSKEAAAKEQDSGFTLEPLNLTPSVVERGKRKRKVVIDNDKEFSGQQIKSQFEDYNDLLQPKCFPPPTKKAMMWREMAGCEQLYSNPTFPGLDKHLRTLIKGNYSTSMDYVDFPVDTSLLEEVMEPIADSTIPPLQTTVEETEAQKELEDFPLLPADIPDIAAVANEDLPPVEEAEPPKPDDVDAGHLEPEDARPEEPTDLGQVWEEPGQVEAENELPQASAQDMNSEDRANIETADENLESTAEQGVGELSEEFEQRRWTKHTQQVVKVLDRNLRKVESVTFSSLTVKCDRKAAASQFYTCLLLAKEGIISVDQSEPYAEIHIQKGPKYVGAV